MLGQFFIFFFFIIYFFSSFLNCARAEILEPVQISVGTAPIQITSEVYREKEKNFFSIPLENMESLEEISIYRQYSPFQLDSIRMPKTQFFSRLGPEQRYNFQSQNAFNNLGVWRLSLGYSRDYRNINYIDNANTPYTNNDDTVASISPKKQQYFLELDTKFLNWQALLAQDSAVKNVLAGKRSLGFKQQNRQELNIAYDWEKTKLIAYGFFRSEKFDGIPNELPDSYTKNYLAGVKYNSTIYNNWIASASLQQEKYNRKIENLSNAIFTRQEGKLTSKNNFFTDSWVELDTDTEFTLAQDQSNQPLSSQSNFSREKYSPAWDLAILTTTSRRNPFGIELFSKTYSLLPKPSYVFGDGSLLMPSPDLPNQSGWKSSLGPWFLFSEYGKINIHAFAEESNNEAILLAASSTNAKAYPIGATWIRGIEFFTQWYLSRWQIQTAFVFQDAINASNINWQYGRPVPGKAKYKSENTLSYNRKHWLYSLSHAYRSDETIDIIGTRKKPTQHKINAGIEFKKTDWRIRLEGNHLFAKNISNLDFTNSSGTNLIEPELDQRSIFLEFEFLLL